MTVKLKSPPKTEPNVGASHKTQGPTETGKDSTVAWPPTAKAKPLQLPVPKPKTKAKPKPAKGTGNNAELGPPPLTLKQIAAHLGVCTKTVRRIIKKKGIPYFMVGGQIRVPAEHLPLFLDKQW